MCDYNTMRTKKQDSKKDKASNKVMYKYFCTSAVNDIPTVLKNFSIKIPYNPLNFDLVYDPVGPTHINILLRKIIPGTWLTAKEIYNFGYKKADRRTTHTNDSFVYSMNHFGKVRLDLINPSVHNYNSKDIEKLIKDGETTRIDYDKLNLKKNCHNSLILRRGYLTRNKNNTDEEKKVIKFFFGEKAPDNLKIVFMRKDEIGDSIQSWRSHGVHKPMIVDHCRCYEPSLHDSKELYEIQSLDSNFGKASDTSSIIGVPRNRGIEELVDSLDMVKESEIRVLYENLHRFYRGKK